MSKKSALMVYQNLANIKEDKEYWDKYIKFHELYWDGPNASQNVFYGNEYEEYRNSLSKYLEIEPDQIKDCLFTKHENGDYYLTPLGVDSDKYIMESENSIPAQWFLMFESKEKKFFYSHAGDGAIQPDGIYYNTDCALSKKRLESAKDILESISNESVPKEFDIFQKELLFGISEMYYWIEKFPDDSMIVLNYAEISSVIHEFTLKNENSVSDLWIIIQNLSNKDFENANSIIEAKNQFFKYQKEVYELSIPFYIESYNYFKNLDNNFAVSILKIASEKAKDNPKALKTIAYKFEESGDYEKAKIIYKRLLKIRPGDEQTYRDLALIYKENEEYELAASLYNKILKNKISNVNVLGLQETIVNEASHMYWTKADKLILTDFPLKTLKTFIPKNDWKNFGYDFRIVFDWNDPAVEFNIQFVDPKKKYYNWSHTIIDDKEVLEDELNYGYNTEEFIIEKSNKGEWIVNIENYSIEDNSNPTYIKYTVYKNYGRPNEIRKVELLDLSKLKQKVTLDVLKYYN